MLYISEKKLWEWLALSEEGLIDKQTAITMT